MSSPLEVWHLLLALIGLAIAVLTLMHNVKKADREALAKLRAEDKAAQKELERRHQRLSDRQANHEKEVAGSYPKRTEIAEQFQNLQKHLDDKIDGLGKLIEAKL